MANRQREAGDPGPHTLWFSPPDGDDRHRRALSRERVVKKSKIVDAERVLTDEECAALAAMGQKLTELHGGPQDIEWAFDAAGDLYLLQSRPITTI